MFSLLLEKRLYDERRSSDKWNSIRTVPCRRVPHCTQPFSREERVGRSLSVSNFFDHFPRFVLNSEDSIVSFYIYAVRLFKSI
jgi:hypothetical protein